MKSINPKAGYVEVMGVSRLNFNYFVIMAYLYLVHGRPFQLASAGNFIEDEATPCLAQYTWIAVWNRGHAVSTLAYIP